MPDLWNVPNKDIETAAKRKLGKHTGTMVDKLKVDRIYRTSGLWVDCKVRNVENGQVNMITVNDRDL